MTADGWTRAVRRQLGLGRLLPLGDRRDGAWITEEAALAVLRRAATAVPGVRLGALRVALADPDLAGEPAVPPPPGALPPGPLRVTGECGVAADPSAPDAEPLPDAAARLRSALAAAAAERLGLMVTEVDLRVTGLVSATTVTDGGTTAVTVTADADTNTEAEAVVGAEADADNEAGTGIGTGTGVPPDAVRRDGARPVAGPASGTATAEESRVAAAALSVPGVARLTDALGRPVHLTDVPGTDPALPRRHVRVELAVAGAGRTADVARAVRAAVTEALPDAPSVAVLVTGVR